MKIVWLIAVSFSFLVAHSAPPKVYAVVVGVSQYADKNIHGLDFAASDADAFAKFLQSPNAGAVPPENMRVLLNQDATRSKVIKAVTELFSRSGKEDLIIFYFAGHGKNDVMENVGYLLSADTEDGNESGSAISMEDITSKINRSKAKMKVSFIDACHAGMFRTAGARGTSNDNAEIIKAYTVGLSNASAGNVAFLACSARQESLEDKKSKQGYFTHYLIEGLRGPADQEQKGSAGFNNGIVTMGELKSYLINKVQQATQYKQIPTVEGQYDDDFPLSIVRSDLALSAEIAKRPATATGASGQRTQQNNAEHITPDPVPPAGPLNVTGTWKLRINSTKMLKSSGTSVSHFVVGGALELVQNGSSVTGKYTSNSPSFRTGDVSGSFGPDGLNLTIASTKGGCMGNAVMTVKGNPSPSGITATVATDGELQGSCVINTGPSLMTKF
jgi:Caspase domain